MPPNQARPAPSRPAPLPALVETAPDGLSPTVNVQPSLLELEDLLEDLKPKKLKVEHRGLDKLLTDEEGESSPRNGAPLGVPALPVPGDVIGGMYRVEGELGSGAMGVVLLAVDQRLKRKVAIKLIQSSLFARHFHDRFLQEARAMAEVAHPNVLVIHAFGEHDSAPYFVTEFVAGTTLDRTIAECRHAIDLDLAFRILDEICLGVNALHAAGIVHRDLKPANILLDSEFRVRVADLGLAQKYVTAKAIKELVGTLGYIAPELTLDTGARVAASPQSDLYSLACIAYELFTGQPPFEAKDDDSLIRLHASASVIRPSFVRGDLPRALDTVLLRALDKDPQSRTPGVEQFRLELRDAREKDTEPTRILVAEDEADFRELLGIKLCAEFPDADVETVSDGQEALAAFERKPASVVILDLQMPLMDGVAATVLLRSKPASATVPIIVLTASGGPTEWKLLSSLGADRFLVKPVDLDDLVAIVRRIVKHRARRSAVP
ncbi:MAG TPA: protein kinase [Polyangiaceae bacterium]|jgi:serine/threonine-protein kinase|nr:protein kinase [Polyangiaceae bacterium]